MFGKNRIEKQNLGDGSTLRIVTGSPFYTIQGEGPYTGHPAVFIRLHGCNLRCGFCDTAFDNDSDPTVALPELLWQVMARRGMARVAVITGGEPMLQNILPLCRELRRYGFTVQIETAGTVWIDGIEQHAEIVCSPKTPYIHPMIREHAVAFKYVISGGQMFSDASYGYVPITATQPGARPAQLAIPRDDALVYLSPCDEGDPASNAFNRKLVGELALRHGVIAGLQLHKFLDLD